MDAMTLYNITDEYGALMAALEAQDGEMTPEQEEALVITEEALTQKAGGYGRVILHYQQMAAAAKAEKERIAALQKVAENAEKRLKERLLDAMVRTDHAKIELPDIRLSTRRSEAVVIDDEQSLPDSVKVIKIEASKAAIKAALKAGQVVPGAHIEETLSLIIK